MECVYKLNVVFENIRRNVLKMFIFGNKKKILRVYAYN